MTTSAPHRLPFTPAPLGRRRRWRRAGVVAGAASAVGLVWTVAVPVAGVDLAVRMGERTQDVGLGSVLTVAVAAGLLGWALLAFLESRTHRAARIWTGVALAVLVLSLAGPVTSAATATAAVVLLALHVAVGAVLIPALRRTSRAG